MRKLIPATVGLLVLVVVFGIVSSNFKARSGAQPNSGAAPNSSTPEEAQPTPAEPLEEESDSLTVDPKGPVAAAKNATESLEAALFLHRSQANVVAKAVVVTDELENQKLTLQYKGPVLATSNLQYKSYEAAQKYSQYAYRVLKYKINKLSEKSAKITLYGQLSWLYPPDKNGNQNGFCGPNLRVVYMRYARVRVNKKTHKRWMLVRDTPASKQPPPLKKGTSVTCDKAIEMFKPLIKGFKDV